MTFSEVAKKVRAGDSLSSDDGLVLYRHPGLVELAALANEQRERLHGQHTYFNRNLHINPTNVCVAQCKLCSFSRRAADAEGAFVLRVDDAVARLQARLAAHEAPR